MHIAKVLLIGRLIDITIYLGTQELAFGGHNENENSFNQGNFRELAKLLSGIMSKTIQNEIIQSTY
jgi:hypothetical protein